MLKIGRILSASIVFFVGSLLFLPLAVVRPFNTDNGYLFSRTVMVLILKVIGLKVEVRNYDGMTAVCPAVIVMNHQHTADLFIFGANHARGSVTVGKKQIAWIPLFGWFFWLSGHILIDRKDHHSAMGSMNKAVKVMVEDGRSIWMFPEGTRSWGKGLGKFKKGAFRIAVQAQVPIVPFVCSTIRKKFDLNRWNSGRVIVEVLGPIPTLGKTEEDVESLVVLAHDIMAKAIARLDAENSLPFQG